MVYCTAEKHTGGEQCEFRHEGETGAQLRAWLPLLAIAVAQLLQQKALPSRVTCVELSAIEDPQCVHFAAPSAPQTCRPP